MTTLNRACELATELGACITLLVPHVVPYPLPLDRPSVSLDVLQKRFESLARDQPLKIRVLIGLCRDGERFVEHALGPVSTIVMWRERGWMCLRKRRLARRLTALGHNVILV